MKPLLSGLAATAFALLAPLVAAQAQSTLPHPALTTLYPCAIQQGSSIEITATGTDLDGATGLLVSSAGLTSKPGAKPGQFTLTAAKDAPTGYADVRVIARHGVSNPRAIAVTKLPVIEMKERTLKASVGQVILGKALKQDSLAITFPMKKGQPVQVLCEPAALDSRLELVLSARDAQRAVLGRLELGGRLELMPRADGDCTLELRDLMYRGDAEYAFVLALSQPGASGLETAEPLQPQEKPDVDASKAVLIDGSFTGWLPARSKPRLLTFQAKKGETRIIEVRCARLGIAADPYFVLEKLDGDKATFIAEANDRPALGAKEEFDAGWADPSYRFEVKEDGLYRVKLRNLYPTRVAFELSIAAPGTAFELVALPSEMPPAKKGAASLLHAPLWRSGTATLKVVALRERGYTGPIALSAEGLPAGVSSAGGPIPEGKDVGYLSLTADAKAPAWGGAVRVLGKAGNVTRAARAATLIRAVPDMTKAGVNTRLAKDIALGVVAAEAPILIEPAASVYETTTTGKVEVPVKAQRRAGYDEALKLTAIGITTTPPITLDLPAKAKEAKLTLDIAKLKLPPGEHVLLLQGSAKFKHTHPDDPKAKPKDVVATIHSKPITLRIKKP